MKKVISLVAAMLIVASLVLTLASCAPKISGTYYSGDRDLTQTYVQFKFSGSKVTIESFAAGVKVLDCDGTYTLNDDKTQITIEIEDNSNDAAKSYSGDFSFEQGDDYIKIGIIKYKKA